MTTRPLALALLLAVAGCQGALSSAGMDADPPPPSDASGADGGSLDGEGPPPPGDAATEDAAPPETDGGLPPGADAGPPPGVDAGPPPGMDAGPPPGMDAGPPPGMDAGPPPPPPPTYTTYFSTRPADSARDLTVENALVALIDRAVPGSRLRVAVYTFTRSAPSAALIRAHDRGVDVRVVLDGGNATAAGSELATLRAGLGADRVTLCDAPGTACVGSGIMHHKTFLFSELDDGSRDVVVQASHNLTNNQLNMHNNAVVVRGDAALFAAYERTFEDLRADVENPDYYRIDDGDLATRVYFFPRASGDTAVSIVNNVTCDATSRIRVAMAFFTNARSAVADALAARAREGCDVRLVVGDAEIPIGSTVLSTLRGAGARVDLYPDRTGGWSLHSKYLLVDAPYAGSAGHRRLVFTGSHNWTGPALDSNDETLLRLEDGGVFDAYMADWERVRAASAVP